MTLEGDAGLDLALTGTRVAQTAFRVRLQHVEGSGVLLGRMAGDEVQPTGPADLFDEAGFSVATSEVAAYVSARGRGRSVLDVGPVQGTDGGARALLQASGFNRHTFLCGQSGSGKTYALGVVLERLLLETDLRLLIIDPNSDFVRLGELRPFEEVAADSGGRIDADGYAAIRARWDALAAGIHVLRPRPRGAGGTDALRLHFSDLSRLGQGLVLQLDPIADPEGFNAFWTATERMNRAAYSLTDLRAAAATNLTSESRGLALRIANLGVDQWDVWAEIGELSLAEAVGTDWRALVLDIGGFGSGAEKSLVAMAVLGYLWERREERKPVLIVVDEAHNVCPQEPDSALQATATERAVRIAGEGRKFGLYFLLSTQRPQKLHVNVLSQADNLILMRMNSAADVQRLTEVFSFVPPSLLGRSSHFGQGESLIAGKLVPSPLLATFQGRLTREGGSDVPTTWARPR